MKTFLEPQKLKMRVRTGAIKIYNETHNVTWSPADITLGWFAKAYFFDIKNCLEHARYFRGGNNGKTLQEIFERKIEELKK